MSSYSRACKYCGRRINLRQMPHGQWVPFEGDQQHVCDEPPPTRAAPPVTPRTPATAAHPTELFKPLYPKVLQDPPPSPQPAPPRTVTPPRPAPNPVRAPQPIGGDTQMPVRVAPQPVPAPQPGPPPHAGPPIQCPSRAPALQHSPTKRRGIVETCFALITVLLSSTFGLMIGAFSLLSLPLNVIAVMHIFGWSWFGALVGVILFSCVPFVGQLGFLILAVMGAYYVWAADFDWQKAAYPPPTTFTSSTLSEAELERFKTEAIRPGLEKACKTEALKTTGFDGKLPARAASQCECFATSFAARLTRADMVAFEKDGRYPDDFLQLVGNEIRRACQN